MCPEQAGAMWRQCRWSLPSSVMVRAGEAVNLAFSTPGTAGWAVMWCSLFQAIWVSSTDFSRAMLNLPQKNYHKLRTFILSLVNIIKQRWSWFPQLQDENTLKSNLQFLFFWKVLLKSSGHSSSCFFFLLKERNSDYITKLLLC